MRNCADTERNCSHLKKILREENLSDLTSFFTTDSHNKSYLWPACTGLYFTLWKFVLTPANKGFCLFSKISEAWNCLKLYVCLCVKSFFKWGGGKRLWLFTFITTPNALSRTPFLWVSLQYHHSRSVYFNSKEKIWSGKKICEWKFVVIYTLNPLSPQLQSTSIFSIKFDTTLSDDPNSSWKQLRH